jgi:hypothetical protein
MRLLLTIFPLVFILIAATGCKSYYDGTPTAWDDMQTDIALRHGYEQYDCGCHKVNGYSKDATIHHHHSPRVVSTQKPPQQIPTMSGDHIQVRELSSKIDLLEEALKSNAGATNQNEALIVSQITALKAQVSALDRTKTTDASQQPVNQTSTLSGIHIGDTNE